MEFKGKDKSFVSEWLSKQGFKPAIVDAFFGKEHCDSRLGIQLKLFILNTMENEVDGDAFLLLSEQIKLLITAMGPQVKFAPKHKLLCKSLPDK